MVFYQKGNNTPLELTLRAARQQDAEQIISCIRDAYGDTYVKSFLYTAEGIAHCEESGELRFSVAEDGQGELAGITAYEQSEEFPGMAEIACQAERYKAIRKLVQFGKFSRLQSPFDSDYTAWQVESQDGSEVIVWFYKPYAVAEEAYIRAFPVNLDPKADYKDTVSGRTYNGSMAMRLGLPIEWKNGDHFSQMWHFVKK